MIVGKNQRQGATAAREARVALGVGLDAPLSDILNLMEETAGIPVAVLELPQGVAGAFGKKEGHSFIFLNGRSHPRHQRFTLAHEYGHARLGHDGMVDPTENLWGVGDRPPSEVQANAFAAEFLAPEQAVRNWIQAQWEEPQDNLELAVSLAAAFRISAEAAVYRMDAASLLTRGDKADLVRRISASEDKQVRARGAIVESPDLLTEIWHARHLPRIPKHMYLNALRGYHAGLLSTARISEVLKRDPADVETEFESWPLAEADEPLP